MGETARLDGWSGLAAFFCGNDFKGMARNCAKPKRRDFRPFSTAQKFLRVFLRLSRKLERHQPRKLPSEHRTTIFVFAAGL
jgi:hypothetical protein